MVIHVISSLTTRNAPKPINVGHVIITEQQNIEVNKMYDIMDIVLVMGIGFIAGVIYQFIQMVPDIPTNKSFVSTKNEIDPPKKPVFPANTIR